MSLFLLPATLIVASNGASISVNTTSIRSGDAVKVSWTGVALTNIAPMRVAFSTSGGDDHVHSWSIEAEDEASSLWVGQFSPPITDAAAIHMGTDPRKHGISTEGTPPFTVPAPNKFISGSQLSNGHWTFKISNMRAAVNWVLFSGSLIDAATFKVLAVSAPVTLLDAAAPMHVRLARTSSTDQMRVSWTSAQGAANASHVVQWGTSATALDTVTPASSTHTYTPADLCGFPANASGFHSPGFFHEAVLDLTKAETATPPTKFFYRVGSTQHGWSEVRSFALPTPVDAHAPLSVVITADMGETYEDGSQCA